VARKDKDSFCAALQLSQLGRSEYSWSTLDMDELTRLYDTEITRLVDGLIPMWIVRFRRRWSHPRFDDDCYKAKRSVHRLHPAEVAAATTT